MTRWRIHRLDETASTNDDACHAAETGEGEGYVVTANCQVSGRGRQGRVWESPAGNLYVSVLLQPQGMPQQAGFYSFVAALAVRETVMECLTQLSTSSRRKSGSSARDSEHESLVSSRRAPLDPDLRRDDGTWVTLKWPNDVLVGGKKISGVLLEVSGDKLIIGIGLNIAHYPDNALYPATSLSAEGATTTPADVLDILLDNIGYWHDQMQKQGFAPIRAAWLEHAQTGPLTVRLPQTLQGHFAGIDETGHLRLLLEDGTERSISTGDVLFQGPKV